MGGGGVRMPMAAKGLRPRVGSCRGFAFRIMLLKAAPFMVRGGHMGRISGVST